MQLLEEIHFYSLVVGAAIAYGGRLADSRMWSLLRGTGNEALGQIPPSHLVPVRQTKEQIEARPPLHLEELESREACNSLFNPLFGTAFLSLEPLDTPYSVIAGDGSTSDSSSSDSGGGDGGGDSSGGTDSTQGGDTGITEPPPNNYSPADPAAAITAIDWNASLFDSGSTTPTPPSL